LWEKEHPQWGNAKAKLYILNAGVVAGAHITYAISDAQPVAMVKPLPYEATSGKPKP